MPISWKSNVADIIEEPYFTCLSELDSWASFPKRKLGGILPYFSRSPGSSANLSGAKLLVCHDYKGGYVETPNSISYTFNFWSSCHTFVYFSHHRITVPPPGWINAAHRQGVKMLGVLIFEPGGEEDCLRLLVGKLPQSTTGPAAIKTGVSQFSLPVSPHYARLLAELASQRGFDGYLLNFECHLQGNIEQTRTLVAWMRILDDELKAKLGEHAEALWYDSVLFTGRLLWQDRLNSRNVPFFLSSSGIFTNYFWPDSYPALSVQYHHSLPESLTAPAPKIKAPLTVADIYTGIDTWGRGSFGGGGFGCYRALTVIDPSSLGLSAALFGHAWTWESIEGESWFTWKKWWENECQLWVGPLKGTWEDVVVPPTPKKRQEDPDNECDHWPFRPVCSFFPPQAPPDPEKLALHTTFCPGVGWGWWVDGMKVFEAQSVSEVNGGWTDIDKQTLMGDLSWPRPDVLRESMDEDVELPHVTSDICFDDAWNGGSSLLLMITFEGDGHDRQPEIHIQKEEDGNAATEFRSVWLPVQSIFTRRGTRYEASLVYKLRYSDDVDVEVGLSVKFPADVDHSERELDVTFISATDDLPGGWSKLVIQFTVPPFSEVCDTNNHIRISTGLIIAILAERTSFEPLSISVLLGQLNVHYVPPPDSPNFRPCVLWADFKKSLSTGITPNNDSCSGILTWETAASFEPLDPSCTEPAIASPEAAVSVLPIYRPGWFPRFLYFNIYALAFNLVDGVEKVGHPEEAMWVGTNGIDGERNQFRVPKEVGLLPIWKGLKLQEEGGEEGKTGKVRFYVQGVDELGKVMKWEECAFVDCDLRA